MIRRLGARSDELNAVLRARDQGEGRTPHVCVKTGQKTDRVVTVRAADLGPRTQSWERSIGNRALIALAKMRGRPFVSVVLPVAPPAWKQWRGRLGRAVAVHAFGLGVLAIAAVRGEIGYCLLAFVVTALGWRVRVRAWHELWVGLTYRADDGDGDGDGDGDIVVSRVHPAFADEAKQLYVGSIWRGLQER